MKKIVIESFEEFKYLCYKEDSSPPPKDSEKKESKVQEKIMESDLQNQRGFFFFNVKTVANVDKLTSKMRNENLKTGDLQRASLKE